MQKIQLFLFRSQVMQLCKKNENNNNNNNKSFLWNKNTENLF